jgi:hypothetical protein
LLLTGAVEGGVGVVSLELHALVKSTLAVMMKYVMRFMMTPKVVDY